MKNQFIEFIHEQQNRICAALEKVDGKATFREDNWVREAGGGGKTRVISDGNVFEKGGVNTSIVHGVLPELIRERFNVEQGWFLAAGISLVIHPVNPFVPTVHANYRYFELYDTEGGELRDSWFGGGADLTPYYLDKSDARLFHEMHKDACDKIDLQLYPKMKSDCDNYFYNTHRGERRGIGGIFYDYLRPGKPYDSQTLLDLAQNNADAFLNAYIPIVEKNKSKVYSDEQRYWQEIRRGRYVEFNLIHDRGTLFGLKTDGRVESILMSLPPRVRWDYDFSPEANSSELELVEVLRNPIDWT
jgi:coproporphyrinogen III oxidase